MTVLCIYFFFFPEQNKTKSIKSHKIGKPIFEIPFRPGNYVHFRHPNVWMLAIFGAECLRMYRCMTVLRGAIAFHTFIQTETYQNVIKYHYSGTILFNFMLSVKCSQKSMSVSDRNYSIWGLHLIFA